MRHRRPRFERGRELGETFGVVRAGGAVELLVGYGAVFVGVEFHVTFRAVKARRRANTVGPGYYAGNYGAILPTFDCCCQ